MSSQADQWYLSFDCATKSFAFSLLRIRPPPADLTERLEETAAAVKRKDVKKATAILEALDEETRECFVLAAGGAIDLVPGKKDKEIPTMERVRAVKDYLNNVVEPALTEAAGCPAADDARLNVAVEFQMGANAPARTVAVVLVSHFSQANTFMVGPGYKNKLWYPSRPDIRHCFFIERYSSLYYANKEHSKTLYFDHVAPTFGHDKSRAMANVPAGLRRDFADSVMQVLGFRAFGDIEKAAEKF